MTPEAFPTLVDFTGQIASNDLTRMATAIQIQCTRDYTPRWGRKATINAGNPQPHHWPVFIQDGLNQPGALGYHTDPLGQPQAFVDFQGGDLNKICQTASHEILEMITDFSGNRLVPSWHPLTGEPVRILAEPCDPSEELGYEINGLQVSDFYLPEWFDQNVTPNIPYTFLNAIDKPRSIIAGGYMSFVDVQGRGWQLTWFDDSGPQLQGPFQWDTSARGSKSLREHVDATTREVKAKYRFK